MLHEVLLALLGHPGSIIQEEPARPASEDARAFNPTTFRVPDSISFLTPTERAAINRVVNLGSTYRSLREFVRPRAVPWTGAGKKDGGSRTGGGEDAELYVRALKTGVEEVLDEYAERVAEVERDVMADPTLPLARVYAGVREYQSVLPAVAEVCAAVSGDGRWGCLKGGQLLEALHEKSQFGAPDVRRRLTRLVWHCSQVLINQCVSWLLHGLLLDPYQEFFVQKNLDPIGSATGPAVRSSLSAGLDDEGCSRYDRFSSFDEGVEGAWRGKGEGRAEEEWNSTYTLRLKLVPTSFVPHGLALRMLFVGKVVRVLRQVNLSSYGHNQTAPFAGGSRGDSRSRKGPTSSPTNSSTEDVRGRVCDGDGGGDVGVSEAEVLELTQRWSELRGRKTFHLLALERAVHQAHTLVDRRLYRLLVNVSGLERHLSHLKGLCLMAHGSLFHSFFSKAREAMTAPAGDRAVLDLNTWLAAAVEDHEGEDGPAGPSSSWSILERARLDLDPPGFACKAFHDLNRQGFLVTGKASHVRKNNTVCLCPGGAGVDPPSTGTTEAQPFAVRTRTAAGCGSLWYASGRELPRGFRTSVAFRCDNHNKSSARRGSVTGTWDGDGAGGAAGSVSFVMHNHRAALRGTDDGIGLGEQAAAVSVTTPNSLCVRLEPDGEGGGNVSIRWNPHRGPSLPPPEVRASSGNGDVSCDGDEGGVRTLGQVALSRSCGLSLGQVNYLIVDYIPGGLLESRRSGSGGGVEESPLVRGASAAMLRVYLNDPGCSGPALLCVAVDLVALIEMGGGRAFVGVSAEGCWRTTLRQWEFHLGSGASSGGREQAKGPLGGVGSGPEVEEMLEAMDSWSGLCLHYRLEWPLHLVLTRETMETYNRLFRFLASVKRTSLELERVWPILMQSRYRGLPMERAWLGPLWMLRARMAFFVSNLAFYLQVDVVEAACAVLQGKLRSVQNFVSLQRAHQEFLSTLRAKFYLDNLEISQGMGRALRHVLRFCCLFSLHGDAKGISSAEVTSLHNAFQDEMKILMPVLERLAKELAMRLNFNGHFSAHAL